MDEENKLSEVTPESSADAAETEAPKPRRKRRTRAEMEADAAKALTEARKGAKKAAKAAEKIAGDVSKAVKQYPVEIFVQYSGNEVETSALVDAAVAQFRTVKKRARIAEFKLYIKPEENAAYYVINGDYSGKIDF